jgi:hypothetical protein
MPRPSRRPLAAVLSGLLLAAPAAGADARPDAGAAQTGPLRWQVGLEGALQPLTAQASGGGATAWQGLLRLEPLLGVEARGGGFALELGAPLRLCLGGAGGGAGGGAAPPGTCVGGLRREDWDSASDFGQLVRLLQLGEEDGGLALRVGPFALETLGRGALVSRYGNRPLVDAHPAGATLRVHSGPVRLEALASDVLAARLFAAEASLDLGALAGGAAGRDGVHAGLGAAHDAGRAPLAPSPPLTVLDAHADVALHRGEALQLWAFGTAGARLQEGGPAAGGQLGLEVEAQLPRALLGARLSARRVGGGYRVGLFGADYELARLSATGLARGPLAEERLPGGVSAAAQVQLGLGPQDADATRGAGPDAPPRAHLSVAAEHLLAVGRTDVDALLSLEAGGVGAAARLVATGLGAAPRFLASVEARARLAPALYLLAGAGTAFSTSDVTGAEEGAGAGAEAGSGGSLLRRGVTLQLGLGVDLAR